MMALHAFANEYLHSSLRDLVIGSSHERLCKLADSILSETPDLREIEALIQSIVNSGGSLDEELRKSKEGWISSDSSPTRRLTFCGTVLYFAVRKGDSDVVRMLLENGANIEGNASSHRTPLQEAAAEGQLEIVESLLERGAQVSNVAREVNATELAATRGRKHSNTPLSLAAGRGYKHVVVALLNHGARSEIEGKDNSPFDCAVYGGHVEVAQILYTTSVELNNRSDPYLFRVAGGVSGKSTAKKERMARFLLEKGANPQIVADSGRNIFAELAFNRSTGILSDKPFTDLLAVFLSLLPSDTARKKQLNRLRYYAYSDRGLHWIVDEFSAGRRAAKFEKLGADPASHEEEKARASKVEALKSTPNEKKLKQLARLIKRDGSLEEIEIIIESGVAFGAGVFYNTPLKENHPLLVARKSRREDVVEYLISIGADASILDVGSSLTTTRTPRRSTGSTTPRVEGHAVPLPEGSAGTLRDREPTEAEVGEKKAHRGEPRFVTTESVRREEILELRRAVCNLRGGTISRAELPATLLEEPKKYRTLLEMAYIRQQRDLLEYYNTFRRTLGEVFAALFCIHSRLVDDKKITRTVRRFEMGAAAADECLDRVADTAWEGVKETLRGIPGVSIGMSLVAGLIRYGIRTRAFNKSLRLIRLAPSISEMEAIIEAVARKITLNSVQDIRDPKRVRRSSNWSSIKAVVEPLCSKALALEGKWKDSLINTKIEKAAAEHAALILKGILEGKEWADIDMGADIEPQLLQVAYNARLEGPYLVSAPLDSELTKAELEEAVGTPEPSFSPLTDREVCVVAKTEGTDPALKLEEMREEVTRMRRALEELTPRPDVSHLAKDVAALKKRVSKMRPEECASSGPMAQAFARCGDRDSRLVLSLPVAASGSEDRKALLDGADSVEIDMLPVLFKMLQDHERQLQSCGATALQLEELHLRMNMLEMNTTTSRRR